jgi:hypothetical protein
MRSAFAMRPKGAPSSPPGGLGAAHLRGSRSANLNIKFILFYVCKSISFPRSFPRSLANRATKWPGDGPKDRPLYFSYRKI